MRVVVSSNYAEGELGAGPCGGGFGRLRGVLPAAQRVGHGGVRARRRPGAGPPAFQRLEAAGTRVVRTTTSPGRSTAAPPPFSPPYIGAWVELPRRDGQRDLAIGVHDLALVARISSRTGL